MQIDRLLGILTLLLQNDRLTAPFLAEKFEVSRRTIARDIDVLCRAGVPLITYQGGGGGVSIAEGFRIDKNLLTAQELSSIITGLKGISSALGQPYINGVLDKLNAQSAAAAVSITESVIIDLTPFGENAKNHIEIIKRAIRDLRHIEFDYFAEKDDSHRVIEPYFLVFKWSSWYVFGFCLHRDDWRLFKLARMHNLALREASFIAREIPPSKSAMEPDYDHEINVKLLFDFSTRRELVATYGEDGFTETAEGLVAVAGFANRSFAMHTLRGYGSSVKVLEPEDIANEIMADAEKIVALYKRT